MLKVTADVLKLFVDRKYTALALLDYSKAVDTLNHAVLISLLQSCGVTKEVLKIFSCYLKERMQRVRLVGQMSSPKL